MRKDSLGLFWQDLDPKEEKKKAYLIESGWIEYIGKWYPSTAYYEGIDISDILMKLDEAYIVEKGTTEKCEPPERTWEDPSYLPGLEEALAFNVELYTDSELIDAWLEKEPLIYDIECYINYFQIAFQGAKSGKVVYMELYEGVSLDIKKLKWVMDNFLIVGFNSINYDITIAALALAGKNNAVMKNATNQIITMGARGGDVLRSNKVKKLNCNHIDLIEVAPLFASLKIYGGRMHTKKMQDLPFAPETVLSLDQIAIVRYYCVNDLRNTNELYNKLLGEISLRERLGREYALELRSKSDAQIAEAVIAKEVEKITGFRCQRPTIDPGTQYKYKVPHFISYESELMKWVLEVVRITPFVVGEKGSIGMPEQLKTLKIPIGNSVYKMGIGGLHSTESTAAHHSDENTILKDIDVESYYPRIILNQKLSPQHLGRPFLQAYDKLVTTRLDAKAKIKDVNKEVGARSKLTSNSLKIVINGSFGKLGSKYSILYAPDLLIQVTITGQLALLMLIEMLELRGIPVVSANTDGIVVKCPRPLEGLLAECVKYWEYTTCFKMDENIYKSLYSRDVNNYIAVKPNGEAKTKGAFSRAGLQKNPTNEVCIDAVEGLLIHGVPVEHTIKECKDITKFLSVRTVKGGAVKDGEYLGKAIRWYYAAREEGNMIYASSGKKVPRSDGAKPLLELPEAFPTDINYDWYIQDTYGILEKLGYIQ